MTIDQAIQLNWFIYSAQLISDFLTITAEWCSKMTIDQAIQVHESLYTKSNFRQLC